MKKKLGNLNYSDTAEKLMPIVNFNSCGGKEDCVATCHEEGAGLRSIIRNYLLKI